VELDRGGPENLLNKSNVMISFAEARKGNMSSEVQPPTTELKRLLNILIIRSETKRD
jgi:hypothetical protein